MRKDILENRKKIEKWISENKPKSYISRELKCKQQTLDVYLKKMNIKYIGNQGLKGIKSYEKKHVKNYLFDGSLIGSHKLKLKLIRDGVKEKKCEICGIEEWNDQEAPLELHHLDGNRFNNDINNIQILCCNCHAQTKNYSLSKEFLKNGHKKGIIRRLKVENIKKSDKKEKSLKKQFFCSCGKEINNRSKRCLICYNLEKRKVKNRPSKEELVKMIVDTSLEAVGRKYGVTGNAVKKWIK